MKFSYLLFDADDTLFDFPKAAARAFSAMCRSNGVPIRWIPAPLPPDQPGAVGAFDRGEVSKDYVTLERFVRFFQALKPPGPRQVQPGLPHCPGCRGHPLPHAEAVCRELVRRGHQAVHRHQRCGLRPASRLQGKCVRRSHHGRLYFRGRRSLQAGPGLLCLCPLPHTRPDAGERSRDRRLPLHRHPGANNAGLPCCWYNPAGKARPEDLRIDYEIRDLRELLDIV